MSDIAFRDDAANWFETDAMRQFFPLGVYASIVFGRSAGFSTPTVSWVLSASIEFSRNLLSEFEASNFMTAAITFNKSLGYDADEIRRRWEKDVSADTGAWTKVEEDTGTWTKIEEDTAGIWTKENS